MARQAVGEKRTRQLSRLAGVEMERILVRGGSDHWAIFRTPDDRHGSVLMVPPYTVRWTVGTRLNGYGHWSSCEGHSFTCPRCGMTSYHPDDIKEKYCGNCHDWTGNEQ